MTCKSSRVAAPWYDGEVKYGVSVLQWNRIETQTYGHTSFVILLCGFWNRNLFADEINKSSFVSLIESTRRG